MTKFCKKCKIDKPVGEFYVRSNGKLQTPCKICRLERGAKYIAIPENRNKKLERDAKYRVVPENRKNKSEYWTEYYAISENRRQMAEYGIEYRAIPKNRKRTNERRAERCRTDIQFKIACLLRTRTNGAVKNKQKAGSAVRDMGCTKGELISHLESLFQPGMAWENRGVRGWHIDHIKPLASFDLEDREQFLKAHHYTNLQPLWAKDNLSKGDKY